MPGLVNATRNQAPCAICRGSGWASSTDERGIERMARCQCWHERQRQWAEGVPASFQGARLANYKKMPGNRIAVEMAALFGTNKLDLYLHGGVGSGKTRLACSVLNDEFTRTRTGLFLHVPMLLKRLQPGFDGDDEAAAKVRETERRIETEPLVCFDDLGAERERATDYTRRTLLMLYEARLNNGLRTIWTSNKSLDELAEMQDDDRLTSRIAGNSEVLAIECPDQRVRAS